MWCPLQAPPLPSLRLTPTMFYRVRLPSMMPGSSNFSSWTLIFVQGSFPLTTAATPSLCFTSVQMVTVLSFLYLGISNDLNLCTYTREWDLMGILFLDLGRVQVMVLDDKYTGYYMFFLHRCSPYCDSKNYRRCKFYERLFFSLSSRLYQ